MYNPSSIPPSPFSSIAANLYAIQDEGPSTSTAQSSSSATMASSTGLTSLLPPHASSPPRSRLMPQPPTSDQPPESLPIHDANPQRGGHLPPRFWFPSTNADLVVESHSNVYLPPEVLLPRQRPAPTPWSTRPARSATTSTPTSTSAAASSSTGEPTPAINALPSAKGPQAGFPAIPADLDLAPEEDSALRRLGNAIHLKGKTWASLVPNAQDRRPAALESFVNGGMDARALSLTTRATLNKAFGLQLRSVGQGGATPTASDLDWPKP